MAKVKSTKKTVAKAVARSVATQTLADQGKATKEQVAKTSQAIRPLMIKTDESPVNAGAYAGSKSKSIAGRANRIIKKAGGKPTVKKSGK
jgi:hypothetical protein